MQHLASFKGTKPGWQGWVERITRWVTKSQYSHSEVCIGNPFEGVVLCVSSVGTDGGVRGKMMQLDPKDWDIVPLPWVTEMQLTDFLATHKGEGYDLIGCVRSVVPFVSREHTDKWFCSEVCATIAGYQDAWRFHPGVLHVSISAKQEL